MPCVALVATGDHPGHPPLVRVHVIDGVDLLSGCQNEHVCEVRCKDRIPPRISQPAGGQPSARFMCTHFRRRTVVGHFPGLRTLQAYFCDETDDWKKRSYHLPSWGQYILTLVSPTRVAHCGTIVSVPPWIINFSMFVSEVLEVPVYTSWRKRSSNLYKDIYGSSD